MKFRLASKQDGLVARIMYARADDPSVHESKMTFQPNYSGTRPKPAHVAFWGRRAVFQTCFVA